MIRYIRYIGLAFFLLLGLNSCKTKKTYSSTTYKKVITKSDWKIHLYWKGEKLSSKLRLEVAEDKGMYLSLRPFPLIEIARFWLMPDELVVVNLMDKRYARVSYRDLPREFGTKITYKKAQNFIFESLEKEELNEKSGQTIRLDKEGKQTLNFRLLRNEYLSSSEDLHLEPTIKDNYTQMSVRELQFLLKYILGKTK